MTPKWTIRRYSKTWPDDGPVWVATAPDVRLVQEKVWVNNFLPSDRYKYCDTFAEAIAWATRKTRTVEVELPKVYRSGAINHKDLGHDQGVMINSGGTDVVIRTIAGAVTVNNKNLKPLAEYLLALHYKKENK